eukprot:403374171
MKNQKFEDEPGYDSPSTSKQEIPTPQDIITIKIKKSDNQIVKLSINLKVDFVIDIKDRVFQKERDEGKNIRLIYQGKILQDQDSVSQYNIKDGAFIHAFITQAPVQQLSETQGDSNNQSLANDPEERLGFDRLLANNAYSEIEVHAIRLQFHSIMMRSGIEKTNETSESLLENEEKWLNKQLNMNKHSNKSIEELRLMSTVLSQRNDLVLPRYHQIPQNVEQEGNKKDFAKGFIIGMILTAALFLFYLIFDSRVENVKQMSKMHKHGIYAGAFFNFTLIYLVMTVYY